MKRRITQVTTKGGDKGSSSLADGTRLEKTDSRFEAIGSVDELNSFLGLLISTLSISGDQEPIVAFAQDIQQSLFDLGGALAFPGSDSFPLPDDLESEVARLNAKLPPLTEFVLPGGSQASALAHVCRTVCRRAERTLWALPPDTASGAAYLNRLSDYFFVLARTLNADNHETQWRGPGN